MGMEKDEIFFGLSGIHNLGVNNFIRIHHLHQEPTTRLTAQIVNTILIPKKGSKERIQFEESRLLYALLHKKKINLAKMIASRLRAALGRKSSPITYGMHLMMLMEKAGVNLRCTEEKEEMISAPIGHRTLKWLGFKLQYEKWNFEGRSQGKRSEGKDKGQEEGTQATTQDDSQSNILYLKSFLMEQLHLMQASLLSKLDSLDSRVQNIEEFLNLQPIPSPHHSPPFDPSDPKGKRPMYSPPPSPPPEPSTHISSPSSFPPHDPTPAAQRHLSPTASFYTPPTSPHPESSTKPLSSPSESSGPPSPLHEPQPSPPSSKTTIPSSPIVIETTSSHSTSSSSSSSTAANRYALAVRPISTRLRSSTRRK